MKILALKLKIISLENNVMQFEVELITMQKQITKLEIDLQANEETILQTRKLHGLQNVSEEGAGKLLGLLIELPQRIENNAKNLIKFRESITIFDTSVRMGLCVIKNACNLNCKYITGQDILQKWLKTLGASYALHGPKLIEAGIDNENIHDIDDEELKGYIDQPIIRKTIIKKRPELKAFSEKFLAENSLVIHKDFEPGEKENNIRVLTKQGLQKIQAELSPLLRFHQAYEERTGAFEDGKHLLLENK